MTASRPRHLPGEEGIWVLILGEMTIFAALFSNFLFHRIQESAVFRAGHRTLDQGYATIETLLLLTSSLCVLLGLKAIRRRMNRAGPATFAGAIACALGFCGMKALEWGDKIARGLTIGRDNFFTYF